MSVHSSYLDSPVAGLPAKNTVVASVITLFGSSATLTLTANYYS